MMAVVWWGLALYLGACAFMVACTVLGTIGHVLRCLWEGRAR